MHCSAPRLLPTRGNAIARERKNWAIGWTAFFTRPLSSTISVLTRFGTGKGVFYRHLSLTAREHTCSSSNLPCWRSVLWTHISMNIRIIVVAGSTVLMQVAHSYIPGIHIRSSIATHQAVTFKSSASVQHTCSLFTAEWCSFLCWGACLPSIYVCLHDLAAHTACLKKNVTGLPKRRFRCLGTGGLRKGLERIVAVSRTIFQTIAQLQKLTR